MTKLQTSLPMEETWVDGATERLAALPTATSALELDVSYRFSLFSFIQFINLITHTQICHIQPHHV